MMTPEELARKKAEICQKWGLNPNAIPKHVAVIMDGNGRWAKERGLARTQGHIAGVESLRATIRASRDVGIRYLTVYVFSTENWRRPELEVGFLMKLMEALLFKETKKLKKEQADWNILGALDQLPERFQKKIEKAHKDVEKNPVLTVNFMFNYGSRDEIVRGVRKIVESGIDPQNITEETISNSLFTAGKPDPDILIRTAGDIRISNYLLWQLAYAECFFLDQKWPDFGADGLFDVLVQFQKRIRRFGGLVETE